MRRALLLSVVTAACIPFLVAATRAPLTTKRGMVASSSPLASAAGVEMLRKGGNAIDAAVAVTLAVGVVDPQSAGIGGGGFALWFNATERTVKALDFRERAPLGATRDMYVDAKGRIKDRMSTDGHLAVAVPGTAAGLWELHRAGGKLPWKDVVAPAIRLAEDGFIVGHRLHDSLVENLANLRRHRESAAVFLKRDQPYAVGDLLLQRDLAETLRTLQSDGGRAFYEGDLARAIATDMEDNGGLITVEDLLAYEPVWRAPLAGTYRGHTVVSFPPPSSGGVHLLQMLWFLEQQDLKALGRASAAYDHLLVEAMRRAYADRATWLGDPAFVDVPVVGLLNPAYLRSRWSTFNPRVATPVVAGDPWPFENRPRPSTPAPPPEHGKGTHTAHLCVVDSEQNAVSLTFTINTKMGSGVVVPGTGILLNNEMDDFSASPGTPNAYGLVGGEANAIAPAKIPLSSMTPTIVFTGASPTSLPGTPGERPFLQMHPSSNVRLVVGAPGGSTIITTVLQVIVNVIDHGMDIEHAVAEPRIHHQWRPELLRAEEDSIPRDVVRGLFARGHAVRMKDFWGNATAIEASEEGYAGASDPRGEGAPAGY